MAINNRMQLKEIKRGQIGKGLLIEGDGYISLSDKENKPILEAFEMAHQNGEAFNVPKPFIVSAVLQKYDTVNANGRVYPEAVLKREAAKYQQIIKDRAAYGESNHPSDVVISIDRIAMNIIEMHWEGKTLLGKVEIIVSEGYRRHGICSCEGDRVANLLLNNLKIGVSSRGVGSVYEKFGKKMVGDDYDMVCWDVVSSPSTPGAYICQDDKEMSLYVENEKRDKSKMIVEKINNISKLLLN